MAKKTEELRIKNDEELQGRLIDLKKTQFNLRFQKASGQLTNTAQFSRVRQEIAQIKTILRQRSKPAGQAGAAS